VSLLRLLFVFSMPFGFALARPEAQRPWFWSTFAVACVLTIANGLSMIIDELVEIRKALKK
jgi:hypothetical protein